MTQVDFTASGGAINTFLIENQRYQHKLSGANVWTQAVDLGANQVGKDGIAHGGVIAIGYGTGGQVYSSTGVSFTTDTTNKAAAYGALGANLYRAVIPNTVFAATAVNGSWDSGSTIGDSSFNINSLVGIEQVLLIGKTDGVYSIDSDGTVVPFTPELRGQANANFASVAGSDSFNGDYYFRTLNGVIEISGGDGSKSRVGLDQLASPDLPTVVVQAITHDDRFLYALCANTSNDLMILRRSIAGNWHVFYWDGSGGTKQGQHIAVSSVFGYPALFFSYYDGASVYTTKFIRLSTFPNPLQDTNYRFDTSTTGRLPGCPVRNGGRPDGRGPDDHPVAELHRQPHHHPVLLAADGGAITRFDATAAGIVTSNPLTVINPGTAVTANFIDLYFDLATNSATTTPVLVGFSMKGAYRPNYRRMHTFFFETHVGGGAFVRGERRKPPPNTPPHPHTLRATNIQHTRKKQRGAPFSPRNIFQTVPLPRAKGLRKGERNGSRNFSDRGREPFVRFGFFPVLPLIPTFQKCQGLPPRRTTPPARFTRPAPSGRRKHPHHGLPAGPGRPPFARRWDTPHFQCHRTVAGMPTPE